MYLKLYAPAVAIRNKILFTEKDGDCDLKERESERAIIKL